MHKCYSNRAYTIATVTVHISTVTVAFVHLIFYYYFFSLILFTPSLFLNTLSEISLCFLVSKSSFTVSFAASFTVHSNLRVGSLPSLAACWVITVPHSL